MGDSDIITAKSPINVSIIKYFNEPGVRNRYPMNDYLTVLLNAKMICAKTSVCAREDFDRDEFWMNGKNYRRILELCLIEVKNVAAKQHSVSPEFLARKVHVACVNNYLPAYGPAAFAAGFISLMAALCRLYKIKRDDGTNCELFPDTCKSFVGGFVQRREINGPNINFRGKLLAKGNTWPDLRVLMVVFEFSQKPQTREDLRGAEVTEQMRERIRNNLKQNMNKMSQAISNRDFQLFAITLIKDNNEYRTISLEVNPGNPYGTSLGIQLTQIIDEYNNQSNEIKAGYSDSGGPNITIFFLEKDAQEITSLIKYLYPSTKPNYFVGLDTPDYLGPEHFAHFNIDPMATEDLVRFAIYTKIGNTSVAFDDDNHILDDNGDFAINSWYDFY